MKAISIDRTGSLPPWVQIKEQIKVAYTVGRLKEGDILPSIRALAKQLDVGDAVVRRAYQELTEMGFLSAEPRQHLMVTDTLSKPPHLEKLVEGCADECDRLIDWARRRDVSSISFARLLSHRATQVENESPSYLYVDRSSIAAEQIAAVIAKAWEIPVQGLSLEDIGRLSQARIAHFTAILVNAYRYEMLLKLIGGRGKKRIFAIKMSLHSRIIQRIRRQPTRSTVLLVLADDDASRVARPVAEYLQGEVGEKVRVDTTAISKIQDLADVARNGKYSLVLLSYHVWDLVPEKARRLSNVIRSDNEMNMESLEKARIQAGVIV